MIDTNEGNRAIEEMQAFREYLKSELGEEGYKEYVMPFKTELQKVDRPAGVNFIELTDIVIDRIEQNTELSEDAKEMGKALYCLAAVELMGDDKFINWITTH